MDPIKVNGEIFLVDRTTDYQQAIAHLGPKRLYDAKGSVSAAILVLIQELMDANKP